MKMYISITQEWFGDMVSEDMQVLIGLVVVGLAAIIVISIPVIGYLYYTSITAAPATPTQDMHPASLPTSKPTPEIIYVTPQPTPQVIYVTPQPTLQPTVTSALQHRYIGTTDLPTYQREQQNASNYPFHRDASLAPWLYSANGNWLNNDVNIDAFIEMRIYYIEGWAPPYESEFDVWINGVRTQRKWPNGCEPWINPGYWVGMSEPLYNDRAVVFLGIMNGTIPIFITPPPTPASSISSPSNVTIKEPLIGTWIQIEKNLVYRFRADGTFTREWFPNGDFCESGVWENNGDNHYLVQATSYITTSTPEEIEIRGYIFRYLTHEHYYSKQSDDTAYPNSKMESIQFGNTTDVRDIFEHS